MSIWGSAVTHGFLEVGLHFLKWVCIHKLNLGALNFVGGPWDMFWNPVVGDVLVYSEYLKYILIDLSNSGYLEVGLGPRVVFGPHWGDFGSHYDSLFLSRWCWISDAYAGLDICVERLLCFWPWVETYMPWLFREMFWKLLLVFKVVVIFVIYKTHK